MRSDERQHLVELGRDQKDRHAGVAPPQKLAVHLLDGPDVDAPGRLADQQDRRLLRESAGENELLRVAAGQLPGRCLNRRSANIEGLDQLPGVALDGGTIEDAGTAEGRPVEALEHEVVGDGEIAQERPAIPVGSDVAEPGGEPVARRRARHIAPGEQDATASRRAQPGDCFLELALPVAIDACDPDDLAGVNHQIDAAQGRQPTIVRDFDIAQRQAGLALSSRVGRDRASEIAADHQPSERPRIDRGGWHGRDQASAAQHRDAIGEAQRFVELVADEDDRAPISREATQHGQQLVHLLRRQHRGRLVENQDLRASIERFQDLDALLLADRQAVDTCERIDREAVAQRELGDARRDRPAILEQRRTRRGLPEHQVLGDGERRHQHEVLVHHAEAMADGVVRRAETHRLPAQPDLPLVRPVQAVEDAHQRRFAGAVLAEQRQDLALPQLEVDRIVGERAPGKPLGDAAQLDEVSRDAPGWRIVDHYWGTNGTSSVPALIAARACRSRRWRRSALSRRASGSPRCRAHPL